jgi:TPR repeat protein
MKKQIIVLGLIIGLMASLQARTLEEAVASCEAGNAKMCIGLGNDFKKRNDPKKAQQYYSKGIGILKAACEKDDAKACSSLAYAYVRGDGVKESNAKAKELYKKSLNIYQAACDKKDEQSCMKVEEMKMHLEML